MKSLNRTPPTKYHQKKKADWQGNREREGEDKVKNPLLKNKYFFR